MSERAAGIKFPQKKTTTPATDERGCHWESEMDEREKGTDSDSNAQNSAANAADYVGLPVSVLGFYGSIL